MKFISLTNSNYKAIIDDEDYDRVLALNTKWMVKSSEELKPEAIRSTRHFNGKHIPLHRFIMNCVDDDGYNIDHKFHNIFDNRKEFLRKADFSQSNMNMRKRSDNTSGEKNISWSKTNNKWQVILWKNKKHYFVGYFNSLDKAIIARDESVKKLYGEFACLI